jgi:hypothetical protein
MRLLIPLHEFRDIGFGHDALGRLFLTSAISDLITAKSHEGINDLLGIIRKVQEFCRSPRKPRRQRINGTGAPCAEVKPVPK